MTQSKQSTIAVVGNDSSFIYLIRRYADGMDCSITVTPPSAAEGIPGLSELVAVIFSSMEILEALQPLVAELTNCDIPIIVCSSAIDQIRSRELGADYCLLHPLTFNNFQIALQHATASKRV